MMTKRTLPNDNTTFGVKKIKEKISIKAPVETCYQAWIEAIHLSDIMKRVLGFEYKTIKDITAITSAEEIQRRLESLKQDIIPTSRIKHWLFSGPGGKLYEVE